MSLTETGVAQLSVDPLPNLPFPPLPQHLTVPPERTAQVWSDDEDPIETEVAVLIPLTETGVVCVFVEPLPS